MKLSRLFAYAAAGMIVGLLIENKSIIVKQKAKDKARKLKDEALEKLHGAG